jgi:tetratricopeptide (TPR) repeat protein
VYEHFRRSERVFVDREKHLSWMSEALLRCKEKSIVLHLSGIGGIGKSSLLEHWHSTIERSIILDCSHITDFFGRLDTIAKGAVRLGISLGRFDVLWSIRQRFVQGIEPAKEEGRAWAMEVLAPLPFIGSLTAIGTALKAISQKLSPKLMGKYGSLGSWLQSRLGKDYLEELLEILWKEPRNAEFLYLDALLEDLNNRKDSETPILIVLDGFDEVDDNEPRWNYRERSISEAELWLVFLSSLLNSVGVVASRKALPKSLDAGLNIEMAELCELDEAGCLELLVKRHLIDEDLQHKITEVSGGNPFIINTICDMFSMGGLSPQDIESFRANTLEEVRMRCWKRLFGQVKDLEPIIERAALLPSFDKALLEVVFPGLKTYQWDQLTRFSFVRYRGDGTWELHSLAEDLVIAELGRKLGPLAEEVSSLLVKESEEVGKPSLLGLAFSVEALYSEEDVIPKAKEVISGLIRRESTKDALSILNNLTFRTVKGRAEHEGLLGWALYFENRIAEAEAALKDAAGVCEDLAKKDFVKHGDSLAYYLEILGGIMWDTSRYSEGEDCYSKALDIQRRLVVQNPRQHSRNLVELLASYAFYLGYASRAEEGLPLAQEAVSLCRQIGNQELLPFTLNNLGTVQTNLTERIASYQEAIDLQRELITNNPDNTRLKAVLAAICNNLGYALYHEGIIPKAEDMFHELIRIRRELNDSNPDVYGGRLAGSLRVAGIFLRGIRELGKAEEYLREAVRMLEMLVNEEPELWEGILASTLFQLARVLTASGRVSDADSAINRAIRLKQEEMNRSGDSSSIGRVFASELALSVLPLYTKTLRLAKAEDVLNEVSKLHSECECKSSEQEYWEGQSLANIGAFHLCADRVSAARISLEKARRVLGKYEKFEGVVSENSAAIILCNLGIALKREGRLKEAQDLFSKSLGILEEILQRIPIRLQHNFAVTLNNYALLLKEIGSLKEAEASLAKSLEIKNGLVEISAVVYQPTLAATLNNQGVIFAMTDRLPSAEESFNKAIQIRRELVKHSREMHEVGLASSLHNLGTLLVIAGKPQEAEKVLRECLEIWERLVVKVLEVFLPKLAKTLYQLLIILQEDDTRKEEAAVIKTRLSSMDFEFSDETGLWIEEEEPLFIW